MEHGFAHGREERQALQETSRAERDVGAGSAQRRRTVDGYLVAVDLPDNLPVTDDEIALLRAFLSDEIRAILNGEDQEG